MYCDITLSETSWNFCETLGVGRSFFNGVAIAKDVPRGSLSDFEVKLYCLEQNELVIDYNREPDTTLPGNLALVRDGIIQRTEPGTNYIRIGPNEVEKPFSIYEDIALSLIGPDTEDGSQQFLTVDCKEGLCDIELADTTFSTCIENIPVLGDIYLRGLAKATDIPQVSLHDFNLPLYCASASGFGGINYTEPVETLKGDLVFLQSGIIERTAKGFKYFNAFKGMGSGGENALATTGSSSSFYQGFRDDTGGAKTLWMLCENSNCEVIIYSFIEPLCSQSGRPFLNAVAFNKTVPQDSLDSFEIGLYCVPAGPGAVINYETQDPILIFKASITPSERKGIIRLVQDPDIYDGILYKLSAGE